VIPIGQQRERSKFDIGQHGKEAFKLAPYRSSTVSWRIVARLPDKDILGKQL
jgi:hypothetical protein